MAKRKYFISTELKNIPRKNLKEYLHNEVFNTTEFNTHIEQTAFNLQLHKQIVRDVVVSYFTNIAIAINTVRKIKTKINVYGFFSIWIEKGRRI